MANPTHSCGKCKKRWTGLARSHCGGCHETFAGIRAFDLHQVGGNPCLDPAVKGMVEVAKPWGSMWSLGFDPSGRFDEDE
jgi:hypothetical protein